MKEIILEINEVHDFKVEKQWSTFDGYEVKTNKNNYFLLISNQQDCCESWGYFSSSDDIQSFIGSELLSVSKVDTLHNKELLKKHDCEYLDEGDMEFINFETSNGTLQFAVYNAHNGYYGHAVLIKISDVVEETGV